MKPAIFLAAALLLAGCAPGYGVTKVDATFNDAGKIAGFSWNTGTEKGHVVVKANVQTGEIEYRADDVLAFRGQEIAAEIYKGLAAAGVHVTESVVRGVVTGALGTAAIQGVGAMAEGQAALEAARIKAGIARP